MKWNHHSLHNMKFPTISECVSLCFLTMRDDVTEPHLPTTEPSEHSNALLRCTQRDFTLKDFDTCSLQRACFGWCESDVRACSSCDRVWSKVRLMVNTRHIYYSKSLVEKARDCCVKGTPQRHKMEAGYRNLQHPCQPPAGNIKLDLISIKHCWTCWVYPK